MVDDRTKGLLQQNYGGEAKPPKLKSIEGSIESLSSIKHTNHPDD